MVKCKIKDLKQIEECQKQVRELNDGLSIFDDKLAFDDWFFNHLSDIEFELLAEFSGDKVVDSDKCPYSILYNACRVDSPLRKLSYFDFDKREKKAYADFKGHLKYAAYADKYELLFVANASKRLVRYVFSLGLSTTTDVLNLYKAGGFGISIRRDVTDLFSRSSDDWFPEYDGESSIIFGSEAVNLLSLVPENKWGRISLSSDTKMPNDVYVKLKRAKSRFEVSQDVWEEAVYNIADKYGLEQVDCDTLINYHEKQTLDYTSMSLSRDKADRCLLAILDEVCSLSD